VATKSLYGMTLTLALTLTLAPRKADASRRPRGFADTLPHGDGVAFRGGTDADTVPVPLLPVRRDGVTPPRDSQQGREND